jgi:hypothetical protein
MGTRPSADETKVLDYGGPDVAPRPEARWPFRVGAWILFLLSLIVCFLWIRGFVEIGWTALAIAPVWVFGVYIFGRIAIFGRYP